MDAIALRLEAIATRVEAIALRLEAIALRSKAIPLGLEENIPLQENFDASAPADEVEQPSTTYGKGFPSSVKDSSSIVCT